MFTCAAKILGIQPTALSEEVATQLALPLRHGGCGLTNWSFLRTVAYDWPAAGNRQQNIRTEALYAIMLQQPKKENKNFYDHLERCKPRMASYWLDSLPPYASLQSTQFALSVLLRLRSSWPMGHERSSPARISAHISAHVSAHIGVGRKERVG